MVSLRLWGAIDMPLLGGAAFGVVTQGTLAGHPQIDDLSHA
jgi:hypothetical protein